MILEIHTRVDRPIRVTGSLSERMRARLAIPTGTF
jgi:hypothetical protein